MREPGSLEIGGAPGASSPAPVKRSAAQIAARLRAGRVLASTPAETRAPVQPAAPPVSAAALDLERIATAGNVYEGMDALTNRPALRPFVRASKAILKRLLAPILVQQSHWNASVARLFGVTLDGRLAALESALHEKTVALENVRGDVEALRTELFRLREEMWARQRSEAGENGQPVARNEAAARARK